MRSLRELMAELEELGRRSKVAAIILGSEQGAEFVFCPPAGPPGALLEMEGLLCAGWRPIGFMATGEVEGQITVHIELLPDISKEDRAAWREVLIQGFINGLRKAGLRAWAWDPGWN